jgi:biotin synthase-like enzyme
MQNVKKLLQSWKHDLAHADGLMGTDYETMNEQEFENMSISIEELEKAIKLDEAWKQEESEFNSHLNIQSYNL